VSIGVATAKPVGDDDGRLFEAVGQNLYQAKTEVKRRISIFRAANE